MLLLPLFDDLEHLLKGVPRHFAARTSTIIYRDAIAPRIIVVAVSDGYMALF